MNEKKKKIQLANRLNGQCSIRVLIVEKKASTYPSTTSDNNNNNKTKPEKIQGLKNGEGKQTNGAQDLFSTPTEKHILI